MKHPVLIYSIVGLFSFLVTVVLVPLFRWIARRLDVVDRPSEARKVHTRIIPYLGGVPFYFSFLGIFLLVEALFPQYSLKPLYPMALVGTLFVLMGLYDDICDMSSLRKLIVELVLTSVLFFWGFHATALESPFGGTWQVGWLALLVMPLWVAGVMNAVNFSDGLDGLAAGLVCICAASIFAISFKNDQVLSCILMAYLIGATLAFLLFNFNPASVFMGDAGALFLGFVLGASTMAERQKGVAVIALTVPMIVMAVPILDTILSFYRRALRARQGKFFSPDRDHLHHRLLALGLSQRQVVLSLYFMSGCMGVMAFILSVLPPGYTILILVLAAMGIGFGVIVLQFVEGLSQRCPEEAVCERRHKARGDAAGED